MRSAVAVFIFLLSRLLIGFNSVEVNNTYLDYTDPAR